MSQAALWHVVNMFHMPDVDLLEQIYDSATVRLAPNDTESATITFDTLLKREEASRPCNYSTSLPTPGSVADAHGDWQHLDFY